MFVSLCHSAGSVLVNYTLTLDKPTTSYNLTAAFTDGISSLNFTVDVASVSFTGESWNISYKRCGIVDSVL